MLIRGWVYVMFNEAMPGLVKVGFTLKDPNLRAAELDSTGTPRTPSVVYEALIESPRDVEQSVHARLKSKNEGKEWFRCSPGEAISAIRDTIAEHGKTIILESSQFAATASTHPGIYYQNSTYEYNRLPGELVSKEVPPPVPLISPSPAPHSDKRRRLRELLSIPERDRTNGQWDEIIELEVALAPSNRANRAR